jgi:hypothetical protein
VEQQRYLGRQWRFLEQMMAQQMELRMEQMMRLVGRPCILGSQNVSCQRLIHMGMVGK